VVTWDALKQGRVSEGRLKMGHLELELETSLFGCTFILYRYSCSHNVTLHQTSALSPLPSFPPVDLVLGTTFSEKSTCFVPWWMLDELITSMSSQT
jgi:hypothetical protein